MNLFEKDIRPVWNKNLQDEFLSKVANQIYKVINTPDKTVDELKENLSEFFKLYSINDKGIEMANEFAVDYDLYCVDEDLTDVFENLWAVKDEILKREIVNWVKTDKIEPNFKIGDIVQFNQFDRYLSANSLIKGEIVTIWEQTAQYTIYCEELGHVKTGSRRRGTIKNYEDVTVFIQ